MKYLTSFRNGILKKVLPPENLTLFRQELERKNDALVEMAAIYT